MFDAVLNAPLFYRCYLTSRITLCIFSVIFQTYSRLIQPYLVLLRHIKSPGILRNILLLPYSGIFQTLQTIFSHSWVYSCILRHIQNTWFIQAYLEPETYLVSFQHIIQVLLRSNLCIF